MIIRPNVSNIFVITPVSAINGIITNKTFDINKAFIRANIKGTANNIDICIKIAFSYLSYLLQVYLII